LAIEFRGDSAEIADTGQCNGKETVKELPHSWPAKRDAAPGGLIGLQLEIGDRSFRLIEQGFLTGEGGHITGDIGDLILVGVGINTGVQVDLYQLGHLVLVFVAMEFYQLRGDLLGVDFFKYGNVAHFCDDRITDPEAIEDGD